MEFLSLQGHWGRAVLSVTGTRVGLSSCFIPCNLWCKTQLRVPIWAQGHTLISMILEPNGDTVKNMPYIKSQSLAITAYTHSTCHIICYSDTPETWFRWGSYESRRKQVHIPTQGWNSYITTKTHDTDLSGGWMFVQMKVKNSTSFPPKTSIWGHGHYVGSPQAPTMANAIHSLLLLIRLDFQTAKLDFLTMTITWKPPKIFWEKSSGCTASHVNLLLGSFCYAKHLSSHPLDIYLGRSDIPGPWREGYR